MSTDCTFDLCYIIRPSKEAVADARKCVQDTQREYAKYAHSAVKREEILKESRWVHKRITERLNKRINDETDVAMAWFLKAEYQHCDDLLKSGLIVHPHELARLWEDNRTNPACRRLIGRYAVRKGWDNVYIGDRLAAVRTVMAYFLENFTEAITDSDRAAEAAEAISPHGLFSVVAKNGVCEEFEAVITADGGVDIEKYRHAALEAFRREAISRRETEYADDCRR